MIQESSSTLARDYPSPVQLLGHGSTSAYDIGQDWSQSRRPPITPSSGAAKHDDSTFVDSAASISGESSNTDADSLAGPTDLLSSLHAELAKKEEQAGKLLRAYWARIESLISDAALDDFTLSRESEGDFWLFVRSVPFACKGELVLLDNGNLRAVWDGEDGSHLGLQFLGGRMLQFVIFRRKKGNSQISRVAGRDTFKGVKDQVRTFDLEAFLNA